MSYPCCENKRDCSYTAVVASIIIGIIAAALSFTGIIAVTPAFLWVLFGIAVVYLAILPVIAGLTRSTGTRTCLCSVLTILLIGILGTILTSVILLGITFATTSAIGTIIVGLLLASFSLVITSFACLVKCVAKCSCGSAL